MHLTDAQVCQAENEQGRFHTTDKPNAPINTSIDLIHFKPLCSENLRIPDNGQFPCTNDTLSLHTRVK